MKKFLLFLFFVLTSLIFNNAAFAENFYIKDYKVEITVDNNGDMNIKEDIDTYFTNPSHGLIRNIPVVYSLTYPDGTQKRANAKISNVSVDETFETYTESGEFNIKIGNPNKLISGDKRYVITYKFKPNIKNNGKEDEFYFNVIGSEWAVPVNKASFKITMPKDFDANEAGLSVGQNGKAGFEYGAKFYSDGKTVWGHTERTLAPFEGLTVRIPLEKNYYDIKSTFNTSRRIFVLLFIIAFTALSYTMWNIYGKDEPVIPIINFYPPKNLNSAEIGAQYYGITDIDGLVSLIVYLASKGYLNIVNPTKNFTLEKVKNYDGKNQIESKLMKILFANDNIRTKSELEVSKTFYKQCSDLISQINKKNKLTIFDPQACTPGKTIVMITCIVAIILFTYYAAVSYSFEDLIFSLIGEKVYVIILFAIISFLAFLDEYTRAKTTSNKIILLIFAAIFSIVPFVFLNVCNPTVFFNSDIIIVTTGLIGIIIASICFVNMPKRNKKGQMMLNNIEGFKKFLETARQEEIERLANEKPGYCFDILPYAFVLGIASVWIKKIETIFNLQEPSWYMGAMNAHTFRKFTDGMKSVSVPSTENGGISKSSGGGGHVGGGHGGGGGHSW